MFVKKFSPKTAWFSFNELCAGQHAQEDYLELAHRYPILFLSDIPQFTAQEAAEAQRFIWLIDVLYDNRVKLVASAEVPLADLFTTDYGTGEFVRTISRLTEMQTQSYLELRHQAENTGLQ